MSLRAIICKNRLRLSLPDIPLMLWLNLSVVHRIHKQSNTFTMAVEKEATGDSKLTDSPFKRLQYL